MVFLTYECLCVFLIPSITDQGQFCESSKSIESFNFADSKIGVPYFLLIFEHCGLVFNEDVLHLSREWAWPIPTTMAVGVPSDGPFAY